jgi:ribonuclease VapC
VSDVVLDASALLALINSEPGADVVASAVPDAIISAVNLSEVVGKLRQTGMPVKAIHQVLQPLGLEVRPFDEEQAYLVGLLRDATQSAGLSLGDRACLCLAHKLGLAALTADRAWSRLSVGVTVKVIRQ